MIPLAFILSWAASFFILRVLPRLQVKEGRMEKPLRPEIGGLAMAGGLILGIFSSIGFISYSNVSLPRLPLLGAAITLAVIPLIGLTDDLYLSLRQQLKLLTLLFPGLALALALIEAGQMTAVPAIQAGAVVAVPLILIPVGIAGASYLVNRLEAVGDLGMGAVAVVALGVIALLKGELSALLVLVAGFGVLLAALYYGFSRPANELIGDIGTYSIGALIAISAIIGGFELAAVIVLIPYLLDLGLSAKGRSLGQLIGGLSGRALTLALMGIEAACGLIAILIYARF
jgi:UDP-N-acetylmuramyl pentapeptide phosphotransferase/UDP-N-acetylglucosamine-1-phosphate transferase